MVPQYPPWHVSHEPDDWLHDFPAHVVGHGQHSDPHCVGSQPTSPFLRGFDAFTGVCNVDGLLSANGKANTTTKTEKYWSLTMIEVSVVLL